VCKPDIVYVLDRGHRLHFWAFAPLRLGGAGEGRSYGKEKSKYLCAGFQPARHLLFGYQLV